MSDTPKEKDKGQRRVYMLPSDLMERLLEYQHELGIASEAEAVRRLLDSALKSRDTADKIIDRFLERLKESRDLSEIAKDVLVGHPHVENIRFGADAIDVKIKDGNEYRIARNGAVSIQTNFDQWDAYLTETQQKALPPKERKPARIGYGRSAALDDDIPF